ncbi:nuclear transport factor 2 family protein [Shewanella sp. C32]|uniref:Nuclear transport factor 2 family protein n=1 Tax=Shewanella electrica TaxID=515560 RepID=A0ABT2FGG2_9GAMM|nr:nuclear transport factor 2 family protein [Shewanella electrica]MCH1923296.1 nuclear transport factor 2 family protein [Shewanella electrica]MCS4555393.1 nuclear transport factor 2 family protein [Shewanella electrica]
MHSSISKTLRLWLTTLSLLLVVNINLAVAEPTDEDGSVDAVLDQLHQNAANADWDSYFTLFTDNASFLGTDKTEHWSIQSFEQYARATKGWSYERLSRTVTETGNVAVFDEILEHQKYGLCRGTGTLIYTEQGWKILQYHLSFPVPNDMAIRVTEQIKLFRQQQKRKADNANKE